MRLDGDFRKPISFVKKQEAAPSEVAKIFGPALAVAANMTADATATTSTDGVETIWNVEKLRRVAPLDRAWEDSREALRAWATKNAASTTAPDDADFATAWTRFEEASAAPSEMLRGVALAFAATEFERAEERSTAERRLTARFGSSAARLFMGDLKNGLSALEEIAANGALFGSTCAQTLFQLRDALAQWAGRPSILEFLRERAERLKAWTPTCAGLREGIAERVRAFELALTTELLTIDGEIGRDAFLEAASMCDGRLKQEAADICQRFFGEKLVAWDAGALAGTRKVLTIDGVEYAFRWCPAGTFQMGSPESEEGRAADETLHSVTLTRGFWTLETEVTQEMYEALTGENPSCFCVEGDEADAVDGLDTSRFPVENVSWEDCQEFVAKLNASGVAPAGFEFRLPTEAEWEYACRAGTTTPFSFGSSLNGDKANCDGDGPYGTDEDGPSLGRATEVGSYAPNAWGLCDMHGNVYEWCGDWYGDYGSGSQTDPTGPSEGSSRVLRGGSWNGDAEDCRSAYRGYVDPTSRDNDCGFRLVLGRKF